MKNKRVRFVCQRDCNARDRHLNQSTVTTQVEQEKQFHFSSTVDERIVKQDKRDHQHHRHHCSCLFFVALITLVSQHCLSREEQFRNDPCLVIIITTNKTI